MPAPLITLLVTLGLMFALWLLSLRIKDASIVDIFWGSGFAIIAGLSWVLTDGYHVRSTLLTLLTLAWGLRLSFHLARRNLGKGEDYRYQQMRARYGERWPMVSLFVVFGLQGLLTWLISLPVQLPQQATLPDQLTLLDGIGIALWCIGMFFEIVADRQLQDFKADHANERRVMDRGLWAWSRHPNYFGEALLWWGIFLIGAATPIGRWLIFSPILITFLLVRVSGVPLLEARMKNTRPGYASYKDRTSAFIPWPPRR